MATVNQVDGITPAQTLAVQVAPAIPVAPAAPAALVGPMAPAAGGAGNNMNGSRTLVYLAVIA